MVFDPGRLYPKAQNPGADAWLTPADALRLARMSNLSLIVVTQFEGYAAVGEFADVCNEHRQSAS
jgi:hypothetical protein